ncbi:MAG: CDP-alcohol phosphatidyltransferase family protein [Planctomycetes bacterium]|nr:CDP-alcohol phosphatidyltransferase family protein [Planctomycetota bacterium]
MGSGSRLRKTAVLPSLVTLANLACGVGALLWLFEAGQRGDPLLVRHAAWLLVLAVFLDAIDGKLARLTGSTSEVGAQLDSLADLVTFGVVPAFLVRTLLQIEGPPFGMVPHPRLLVVGPIAYACCSALRLARFNVMQADADVSKDRSSFIGLPTPAAAGLPIALVLFFSGMEDPAFLLAFSESTVAMVQEWILRILPFSLIVLAMLMVSNLPFPHFVAWASKARHGFQRTAELTILLCLLFVEPEFALLLFAVGFIVVPALGNALRLVFGGKKPKESTTSL